MKRIWILILILFSFVGLEADDLIYSDIVNDATIIPGFWTRLYGALIGDSTYTNLEPTFKSITMTGLIESENINADGSIVASGLISTAGDLSVADSLYVGDDIVVFDDVTVGGNLSASGDLKGDNLQVNTDLTIDDDCSVGDSLYVGGDLVVKDDLYVGDSLYVANNVKIDNSIIMGNTVLDTTDIECLENYYNTGKIVLLITPEGGAGLSIETITNCNIVYDTFSFPGDSTLFINLEYNDVASSYQWGHVQIYEPSYFVRMSFDVQGNAIITLYDSSWNKVNIDTVLGPEEKNILLLVHSA